MSTENSSCGVKVLFVVPSVRPENGENLKRQHLLCSKAGFDYLVSANSKAVLDFANLSGIPCVTTGANVGFAAAVNFAASSSPGWDYLVLLNDDVVLSSLDGFLAEFDLGTPRSVRYFSLEPWRPVPCVADVLLDLALLHGVYRRYAPGHWDKRVRKANALYKSFAFVAISRTLWDELEGLSSKFPFTYEDANFMRSIADRRVDIADSNFTFGHHLHSVSTKSMIDRVLPVTVWSAREYLVQLGYQPAVARLLCSIGLILRVPLIPWSSSAKGRHLLGTFRSLRGLVLDSRPRLPHYDSFGAG